VRMTIAVIAFFVVSAAAYAQLPPAAELLPPGFKVLEEKNMSGVMSSIRATSAKGDSDEGVKIGVSWQMNPMADRVVEMIASQPEAKASDIPGLAGREEPCGKQRYRGGVFTCRKQTIQEVGSNSPARVTLKINWQGKGSDGLINISIDNASKETAMGWLDSMIPKIIKSKK